MSLITNPAVISIVLLCILCLKRINVLLAIIISTLTAGILSGINVKEIMDTFISGMGNNSETALSYILLGALTLSLGFSSCVDYLDKSPESDISSTDAFKDFQNFQGFTEELYPKDPITIVDAETVVPDVMKEEKEEVAESRSEDPTNGTAAQEDNIK